MCCFLEIHVKMAGINGLISHLYQRLNSVNVCNVYIPSLIIALCCSPAVCSLRVQIATSTSMTAAVKSTGEAKVLLHKYNASLI